MRLPNFQSLQVTYFQSKVLIHESRGKLSLLVQTTIQCVFYPKITVSYFYVNQIFSADATMYRNSNLQKFTVMSAGSQYDLYTMIFFGKHQPKPFAPKNFKSFDRILTYKEILFFKHIFFSATHFLDF